MRLNPVLYPAGSVAAYLVGVSMAGAASDNQVVMNAIVKVFDEYGGWDTVTPTVYKPIQMQAANLYPMKMRIPGRNPH